MAAIDDLRDGDIVLVTSKVVSKAEGRLVYDDRLAAVESETVRVVARRGPTVIAQTRHGLVMAAAGVDTSNTPPGTESGSSPKIAMKMREVVKITVFSL